MVVNFDDPELQLVLRGPVFPELLRDDASVIDEDGWYRIMTPSSARAVDNEILFSKLGPGDVDAQLDAIIGEYHERGLSMRWCVYPWTEPSDLAARLVARGARHWGVHAVVRKTADRLDPAPGIEVERVDPTSPESLETYVRLMSEGWEFDQAEENFRRRKYQELIRGENPKMMLFVARCDGVEAGVGSMVFKDGAAYLGMGGDYVSPQFRGRGLFRTLEAVRLELLHDMGVSIICGHGRVKTAGPRLLRMGHTLKYTYQIYQIDPAAASDLMYR